MTNKPRVPGDYTQLLTSDQQRLHRMLKKGATRRDMMRWMLAGGLAASTSSLIIGSATRAYADTPKSGGKMTFAFDQHSPADTLDPILFTNTIDYFRGRMYYGSLVRLTNNLGYEPELAEEIIPNEDATVWTFKLRKGVEFHNGKTLTADDVVYSMNRHLGENSLSNAAALVTMVDSWEKVNEHEVRANLSSPYSDLPIVLGTFHFKIVPDGTEDFATAVGTGPYRAAEFKPGVRSVGTKFENFWDEGGYLDEIETYAISDPVSRVNAFLSGDVDAAMNLPPNNIETVNATEGRDVWEVESGAFINIEAQMEMLPAEGGQDLLLAMKHLQDRKRIVKGVLQGHGSMGNDQPIGPTYFDHCPDIPQRELDLDKAKYHFQKSGLGDTAIELVAAPVAPGAVEQCTFMQREAAKIGMNMNVRNVSTDGYYSSIWAQVPFFVVRWNMRPSANMMLSLAWQSGVSWNGTKWGNEQFDQLLESSRAATDPAVRKQMYCDLQTMLHNDGGNMIPAHLNLTDGIASDVKGRTFNPLTNFGGAECPQYLWRESA